MNNKTKHMVFITGNLILLISLSCILYNLHNPIKEGITNMGCCGGVEAGVHYQETDRRPPEYIRRCFRSERDPGTGHFEYDWSGFPCSSAEGGDCCTDESGNSVGVCVPTTGGGYCDNESINKIFKRGSTSPSSYVKRGRDTLLDINDTLDMEDYFFDRSSGELGSSMSDDMLAFMQRRDINNEYIQTHITNRNRSRIKQQTENRLKAEKEKKEHQIKSLIIFVHVLVIFCFSIFIKHNIITYIDSYYAIIHTRYLEFSGKTLTKIP